LSAAFFTSHKGKGREGEGERGGEGEGILAEVSASQIASFPEKGRKEKETGKKGKKGGGARSSYQ